MSAMQQKQIPNRRPKIAGRDGGRKPVSMGLKRSAKHFKVGNILIKRNEHTNRLYKKERKMLLASDENEFETGKYRKWTNV